MTRQRMRFGLFSNQPSSKQKINVCGIYLYAYIFLQTNEYLFLFSIIMGSYFFAEHEHHHRIESSAFMGASGFATCFEVFLVFCKLSEFLFVYFDFRCAKACIQFNFGCFCSLVWYKRYYQYNKWRPRLCIIAYALFSLGI